MEFSVKTDDLVKQAIDRFWETIPPVWNAVRGNVRETAARDFSITVEQFHILRHVNKGVCSISELAQVKQISRPAISQAVDILVNEGLLTRQQNSQDRRFVQLALTDAGASLLAAIFDSSRRWMDAKLQALPEEELLTIIRGMDSLRSTFITN
jgi:DNA-binding MarR family transcriptional regulator